MKHLILAPLIYLLCMSHVSAAYQPPLLKGIRQYDIGMAPNFKLKDIDDVPFELKDTRGNWVFLHFWASWCGPCRKEMPTIEKLIEKTRDKNFKVIMVNTAEDDDTIFTFMASVGLEATTLMDRDGLITEKYKPRGLPTTFLIDPTGRVRYQAIGGREWDNPEYIKFINELVKH